MLYEEKWTWIHKTFTVLEKIGIEQINLKKKNTSVISNADKIYKKRARCPEIGW